MKSTLKFKTGDICHKDGHMVLVRQADESLTYPYTISYYNNGSFGITEFSWSKIMMELYWDLLTKEDKLELL